MKMADHKNNQPFQNSWYHYGSDHHMIKNNDHNYENCTSSSSSSSSSMVSSGSDTTTDDGTSSSSNSNGSLYDLSEIMAQLPIKRGLSKFYNGKSESFASLTRVTSTEDLAKKVRLLAYNNNNRRRKKMKVSKSYGTGLNSYKKNYTLPKPIISKKTTRPGHSPSPSPAASLLSSQTKKRGSCSRLHDQ